MSGRKTEYGPDDYAALKIVDSLEALFSTPFEDANVILYPRTLGGDFNNAARQLQNGKREFGAPPDYEGRLEIMARRHAHDGLGAAAAQILRDIEAVRTYLRSGYRGPDIRLSDNRNWSGDRGVEKFHVDSCMRREFGRLLCCYTTPVTQWIRNSDAIPIGGGTFKAKPDAEIYSFRPGDMFRIKSLWNGRAGNEDNESVSAYRKSCFIHRVPSSSPQEIARGVPRLLWVAG